MGHVTSDTAGGLLAVFDTHRLQLLGFARRSGAMHDAEDIIQDVWLRIQAVDRPVGDPLAYLYRVTYTVLLDRRRGERRASNRDGDWHAAESGPWPGASEAPASDRILVSREALAAAQARLAALGEPIVTIFRRHRVDGETQRHIAADLGLGLSTVEKYLRRAYAALLELRGDKDEA
ncbi:RNA polymerase sigma factor [Sphingomonas sp. PB4P5]|uniref:RNA polymerase sigma factor n=1 Tax=Parasphingomonas puruogangriensis TaxID=3096155 RepID=UPI002FCC8D98